MGMGSVVGPWGRASMTSSNKVINKLIWMGQLSIKKEALCAYVYTMYKLSNGHQFFFNLALDGLRISIILLELKFTDQ